ncbi:MAG: ribulose-phosphate 3-epimerase [Puniceicoccaceae bacterium]|nr:ribulose-phosphate 3-epimerase [Puniceicoccaceae bacterium]
MSSPHETIIAPSILAGDHSNLVSSLQQIEKSGAPWVHLDIMDGHFVPNLTFGPQTVKALREQSNLFFDVHLMLDSPHNYIDAFIKSGSDQITIHVEPNYSIKDTLETVRNNQCLSGIALNPDSPVELIRPYLNLCDIVVVMAVQPGFGGQIFDKEVTSKIKVLDRWRCELNLNYRIEVDGGVDSVTGKICRSLGADTLVTGTSFYKSIDRKSFVRNLCTTN